MAAASETIQAIRQLTPLADVLALIDREVKPVAPRMLDRRLALSAILAADVTAPISPKAPVATIDGWALAADTTSDASGYAPVMLQAIPRRIEVGHPMPPGTDCVAPFDAVKIVDGHAEVFNTIIEGEGVLPAGGDSDGKTPLRRSGEALRGVDLAALGAAGISRLSAIAPRIIILPVRDGDVISSMVDLIGSDTADRGALSERADRGCELATALAMNNTDAVIAVGGTGQGRDDSSVEVLASQGRVVAHGIALSPGETAAFGFVGTKPVLLLPGRLDAALAIWLTIGRRTLARLTAYNNNESPRAETIPLSRKIASTAGLAEIIPVRCIGGAAEPLAARYLGFSALARSDGYVLVPAESEGYSAGTPVSVWPWP